MHTSGRPQRHTAAVVPEVAMRTEAAVLAELAELQKVARSPPHREEVRASNALLLAVRAYYEAETRESAWNVHEAFNRMHAAEEEPARRNDNRDVFGEYVRLMLELHAIRGEPFPTCPHGCTCGC